jgi:hypothetical protein
MAKARGPKRAILQAETIGLLADGLVGRVINRELENLFRDVQERPDDPKPRELVIKLQLCPVGGGQVDIDCKTTAKVPPIVPPRTTAKPSAAAGGLVFNPEVADSPDQMTINDLDPEEAERG